MGELDEHADYNYLNQGITEGTLRMIPSENYITDRIPELASAYNNPPIVIAEANHAGNLPGENQYISIESKSTMLSVVKKAEESGDIIIRLAEYGGTPDKASVYIKGKRVSATVNIGAYEIKTLCINAETLDIREMNMLEE
jgi:alpha-mannosidase